MAGVSAYLSDRYRISRKHPEIPFDTVALGVDTREEVLETVKPLHVDNPHVVAFGIGKKHNTQMISIFNGGFEPMDLHLPDGKWALVVNAEKAGVEPIEILEDHIHVEPICAMILVKQA